MNEAGSSTKAKSEDRNVEKDPPKNTSSLNGWTKNDKCELLQALKSCQTDDEIDDYVANKSKKEIQDAIDFYDQKAKKKKTKKSAEKNKIRQKGAPEPLSDWADVLNRKHDLSDLTNTPNEEESDSESYDFMKMYHLENRQNLVWLCACIGLIIGIAVVVMDNVFATTPTLSHHFSMVAFAIALASLGWGIGQSTALMSTWHEGQSLQPPEDLDVHEEPPVTQPVQETKKKYSKAQARHRYKQGKH